jgi:RNA polymerase sigma-70 factor, ECF subfamily
LNRRVRSRCSAADLAKESSTTLYVAPVAGSDRDGLVLGGGSEARGARGAGELVPLRHETAHCDRGRASVYSTSVATSVEPDALEEAASAACRAGDFRLATTLVVRGYGGEILGFLGAVTRDVAVAEDVFSRFCEDVWRGLPAFRWESSLRTWCYLLARHARIRHFKRAKLPVVEVDDELDNLVAAVRTETASYLRSEVRDALHEARAQLDADDQTLLILRVNRTLSWQEIARVMIEQDEVVDDAVLVRKAAALRKRFERIKQTIREQLT